MFKVLIVIFYPPLVLVAIFYPIISQIKRSYILYSITGLNGEFSHLFSARFLSF
jgi:hypothetical protein